MSAKTASQSLCETVCKTRALCDDHHTKPGAYLTTLRPPCPLPLEMTEEGPFPGCESPAFPGDFCNALWLGICGTFIGSGTHPSSKFTHTQAHTWSCIYWNLLHIWLHDKGTQLTTEYSTPQARRCLSRSPAEYYFPPFSPFFAFSGD